MLQNMIETPISNPITIIQRPSESGETLESEKFKVLFIKMDMPLLLEVPGLKNVLPTHAFLSFSDCHLFKCVSCRKATSAFDFKYANTFFLFIW